MAEEVVVKENLSREMIEAGRKLTVLLEDAQISICASLWLYLSEPNRWRLMIASPMVSKSGPRGLYEKIQSLILESPEMLSEITLFNISVVEPNHRAVATLGASLKTVPVGGMKFSGQAVNGYYVEDAYIYKLT